MKSGPRIYNLFPTLVGPIDRWSEHLSRIAAMRFNWVYVNPFHLPGSSGSLYAIKDYYGSTRSSAAARATATTSCSEGSSMPPTRLASR